MVRQYVGPVLAAEARPLPPNLVALMVGAGEDGVVYASLGTTFHLESEAEARGLAAALAGLNRTVIWQLREGSLPAAVTLGSLALPPSVHVVAWAPQNDVLGHPALRAFVTHSGINSMYEAAWHGVPVAAVPLDAEQADNAAKAGVQRRSAGRPLLTQRRAEPDPPRTCMPRRSSGEGWASASPGRSCQTRSTCWRLWRRSRPSRASARQPCARGSSCVRALATQSTTRQARRQGVGSVSADQGCGGPRGLARTQRVRCALPH